MLRLTLLCASVALAASGQMPVITLDGENPVILGPSEEDYVDPGASCYDPDEGVGASSQMTLTIDSKTVNLAAPSTYFVTYDCVSPSGAPATPKTRKIIVDDEYAEDFWEGDAQIELGGYDEATFGRHEQLLFLKALAKALVLPESALEITELGAAAPDEELISVNTHEKEKSVIVQWRIMVTQYALIEEVVNRAEDPKFGTALTKAFKDVGLRVDALKVNDTSFTIKKVQSAALALIMVGGGTAALLVAVGAYKLHKLSQKTAAASGYSPIV